MSVKAAREQGSSASTVPVSSDGSVVARLEKPSLSTGHEASMTESMEALMELAEAVSAELPCNPNSPKNKRSAKAVERAMARYFRQLEAAFPLQAMNDIYERYTRE